MTYTLMSHQQQVVDLHAQTPIVFNEGEAGVGKTLPELHAWAERRRTGGGRLLVFCPKSCTNAVWVNEVEKFFSGEFLACASMAPAVKRQLGFQPCYDITVTNHDAVKWLMKQTPKTLNLLLSNFDTLVWDESDALRHSSARTKAALALSRRIQWKYKSCLSATPFNKSITELFFQTMFLDGGLRLGKSFYRFRGTVCDPIQVGPSANHIQWTDKDDAPAAVAGQIQDISIRHKLQDCVDIEPMIHRTVQVTLPPTLMRAYNKMKDEAVLLLKDDEAVGVNAATLSGKLLQICLSEGTEVLTDSGWTPIETVSLKDLVWDGFDWASCDGHVYNGYKETVTCWGVDMTPDHKVFTQYGWATAQEILNGKSGIEFTRATFWLPKGNRKKWDFQRKKQKSSLVMSMRLWQSSNTRKPVSQSQAQEIPTKLRLPSWKRNAQETRPSIIQSMDKDKVSLQLFWRQRLQKLWRPWNYSLQSLGRFCTLFRRYGNNISARVTIRAAEQVSKLFSSQLLLGYCTRTVEQHTNKCNYRYTQRKDDSSSSGSDFQPQTDNYISTHSARMDQRLNKKRVYDLVNVGTRNQFLVRNPEGYEFIVHNCSGSVYGIKSSHVINTERYELAMQLAYESHPTVIFFNYRHQRDALLKEAAKLKLVVQYIDGSVNSEKRLRYVKLFQAGLIDVFLLQINSAAHGITLTRSARVIFCTPPYSPSIYQQAVGRIHRKGQTQKTESILLVGKKTLEEGVVETLLERGVKQKSLLELLE